MSMKNKKVMKKQRRSKKKKFGGLGILITIANSAPRSGPGTLKAVLVMSQRRKEPTHDVYFESIKTCWKRKRVCGAL
jgi:hypothetical protein